MENEELEEKAERLYNEIQEIQSSIQEKQDHLSTILSVLDADEVESDLLENLMKRQEELDEK